MGEFLVGVFFGVLVTVIMSVLLKPHFRNGRLYTIVGRTKSGDTLFEESDRVIRHDGRVDATLGTVLRASVSDGYVSFGRVDVDHVV